MKTVIWDTESTGLKDPRLVQLAWMFDGMEPAQQFFKPYIPIEFGAMAVHHITEEMVVDCEHFSKQDIINWTQWFKDYIPVAHNLPFDVGVMANEGVTINGGIDTLKVARAMFPNEAQHKLQYLRYSLALDVSADAVAHDALGDVYVLKALFDRLVEELKIRGGYKEHDDILQEMIRITGAPSIITKMQFGKHRGMSLEELIKTEPGYVKWLLNQQQLDSDLRHSLLHTKKKLGVDN